MPAPRIVFLAQLDAYQRIHDEACESPGRETGGILVGRMFRLHDGPCLVVVAASGPGINADRRAHTYAPDTVARQRELEAWRQHFATYGVDYVGEWHKHPPGLRQPSTGDTLQVVEILSDESYHLPDGIFTPLVTIEDETFLLHGYYYPRETMRPTAVPCQCVDGDIRTLLEHLAELERQVTPPAARSEPAPAPTMPSSGRWGVNLEALRAARASLSVSAADVVEPEDLPPESAVIDLDTLPGAAPTVAAANQEITVPPFPTPPHDDQVPVAPRLPGRAARERSDLEQFCVTLRWRARLTPQAREDGGVWYRVTFGTPPITDLRQIEPSSGVRRTPEGTVLVSTPAQEAPPAIAEITIDPGDGFPEQPPEVSVLLSDGRRLRVLVVRLFASGWRSHFRLRDVLRMVLDALTQSRAPQQIGDLLEFHGRLVVRQVEITCRSVADLLAEFNRAYSFQHPGQIGELDPPE